MIDPASFNFPSLDFLQNISIYGQYVSEMGSKSSKGAAGAIVVTAGPPAVAFTPVVDPVALIICRAIGAVKLCYDIIQGKKHWFHNCDRSRCNHNQD